VVVLFACLDAGNVAAKELKSSVEFSQ
jgi:hypothetical protein